MAAILEICKLDSRAIFLKIASPKIRKEFVMVMLAVILKVRLGEGGGGVHGDLFLRLDELSIGKVRECEILVLKVYKIIGLYMYSRNYTLKGMM